MTRSSRTGWRSPGRDRTYPPSSADLVRTPELVRRAQDGDEEAAEVLCGRYLPRLSRWASGRLPAQVRRTLETGDLVQTSLLKMLRLLAGFEPRHADAFSAYLHTAVLNQIRDELRRLQTRPELVALGDHHADPSPSPLEAAAGEELLERYLIARQRLRQRDRSLLTMRIEMDLEYPEIATALGRPGADAVRMATRRAVIRLAREMEHVAQKARD